MVGHQSRITLIPAFILGYFLALISILDRVARAAFDDFRPALGDPAAADAYRERLSRSATEPRCWPCSVGALMFNIGYYVFVSPYRRADAA